MSKTVAILRRVGIGRALNKREVGNFFKKLITEWAQLFGTPVYTKPGYN